jgi:hypothetical protein
LGLVQAAEPVEELALLEIDDAEAAVAELGHEQALPGEVDGEMVDPAPYLAQRDLALKRERVSGGRTVSRREDRPEKQGGEGKAEKRGPAHARSAAQLLAVATWSSAASSPSASFSA